MPRLPPLRVAFISETIRAEVDAFPGGATLVGSETLTLQISAGQALVYGATVDNRTNDSSMGIAQRQ